VVEQITFVQSDFQNLHNKVQGPFDAVLTKGNSLPHLIRDDQIEDALLEFYELLRPDGFVLIGFRDFEPLLEDRPRFWPGRIHDEAAEQIITFDIWDWNDGPPITVTFNRFVVRGADKTYYTTKHPVIFRALTSDEVEVVLDEVGFKNVQTQHDRWELVMTATK
jgi:SAM-dependent methyltransferase